VVLYTPAPLPEDGGIPAWIERRVLRPAARMLVWENLRLGPTAREDVLFCPSYSRPLLARGRTVLTVHEATPALHPDLYGPRQRLYTALYGWSARHATRVIAHTEAGRRDIVRGYGVDPERVRVVPPAPADGFGPRPGDPGVEEVRRRHAGGAPYFLFVGKLSRRRRVPALVAALAEGRRRTGFPHRLVVVGPAGEGGDPAALARAHGVEDAVKYLPWVPDAELARLYAGATAFVLPCAYESVSLTTLEAQASGVPVITTDTPGLREITGGAALLLAEPDVPAIASALARVAGDADLRRRLSAEGLGHARRLSWERTARSTLGVLVEAAGIPGPAPATGRRAGMAGGSS
jgi:glycosyltransferase involved in cell wall biosynthesis